MTSTPALPMLARHNDEGVSVNESAVCARCATVLDACVASLSAWALAEDVQDPECADVSLYPIDNPEAVCIGCGAAALFPEP